MWWAIWKFLLVLGLMALMAGCQSFPTPPLSPSPSATGLRVLAVETFLADIAQNVAGERLHVEAFLPLMADLHSFEPTPSDVARLAESDVLIINGAGLERALMRLVPEAGKPLVIEASAGLKSRVASESELAGEHEEQEEHEGDPHFWLDPHHVIRYVENIRDGLSRADPDGAAVYAANAEGYIRQLQELDRWIAAQVAEIPPDRRLLVTDHESFGYFADRYGFRIIGAVVPSFSTGASPSAQYLAQLVEQVKATGVPAIFLESGSNPQLAEQIARETGVQVVTELYSHSITDAHGPAPTYLEMMRYNTRVIVEALR
jgi:ABC-type Zn uptake system ZnuABC Zn-binding protein ZnuA